MQDDGCLAPSTARAFEEPTRKAKRKKAVKVQPAAKARLAKDPGKENSGTSGFKLNLIELSDMRPDACDVMAYLEQL